MSVPSISIIGAGNIGSAVAGLAVKAGASTQVLVRDASKAPTCRASRSPRSARP